MKRYRFKWQGIVKCRELKSAMNNSKKVSKQGLQSLTQPLERLTDSKIPPAKRSNFKYFFKKLLTEINSAVSFTY